MQQSCKGWRETSTGGDSVTGSAPRKMGAGDLLLAVTDEAGYFGDVLHREEGM